MRFARHARPEKFEHAREMRKVPTPEEETLWRSLRANKAGAHFRRQAVVLGWIVDFYSGDPPIVVEIDGGYHDDPEVAARDAHRDSVMRAHGFTVLRFPAALVRSDALSVVSAIRTAIPRPRPRRRTRARSG